MFAILVPGTVSVPYWYGMVHTLYWSSFPTIFLNFCLDMPWYRLVHFGMGQYATWYTSVCLNTPRYGVCIKWKLSFIPVSSRYGMVCLVLDDTGWYDRPLKPYIFIIVRFMLLEWWVCQRDIHILGQFCHLLLCFNTLLTSMNVFAPLSIDGCIAVHW